MDIMNTKRVMLSFIAALSAAFCMAAAASAETYIRTPDVPAAADSAAKKYFSHSVPSDFTDSKKEQLSLGNGFCIYSEKGISDNMYYYPVLDGDTVVGVTGVSYLDGRYMYSAISESRELAEGLNALETTEETPAVLIWVNKCGCYAVTEKKAVLLSRWMPAADEKLMKAAENNLPSKYDRYEGNTVMIGEKETFAQSQKVKYGWITENGRKYYVGSDGLCLTGWYRINGKLYYFRKDSGAAVCTDARINGVSYRFNKSGECLGIKR